MNAIEKRIKERFNQISDWNWFPIEINSDNFQAREVFNWLGNVKGNKILDAGCAKGRFTKLLVEQGADSIGIDLADNFVEIARQNCPQAEFQVASVTDIPFDDDTFDGILCIEVMEHVPDTEKGIQEMVRILKPSGKIIIIDKNILSLQPKYLVPTFIWKRLLEVQNKWMYPNNFPFREKYFTFGQVNKILRKYCSTVKSKYLPNGRSRISRIIYNILPFLSYDIAWRGIK